MSHVDTVTIRLESFDAMRTRVASLESELGKAQAALADASLRAGGGELAVKLRAVLKEVMPVVQFAQGNLDPETIRGWPHAALAKFAEDIKAMPDVTQTEIEWAADALKFAAMAQQLERARKLGVHQKFASIPRSSLATGEYEHQAEAIIGSGQGRAGDPEGGGDG